MPMVDRERGPGVSTHRELANRDNPEWTTVSNGEILMVLEDTAVALEPLCEYDMPSVAFGNGPTPLIYITLRGIKFRLRLEPIVRIDPSDPSEQRSRQRELIRRRQQRERNRPRQDLAWETTFATPPKVVPDKVNEDGIPDGDAPPHVGGVEAVALDSDTIFLDLPGEYHGPNP